MYMAQLSSYENGNNFWLDLVHCNNTKKMCIFIIIFIIITQVDLRCEPKKPFCKHPKILF